MRIEDNKVKKGFDGEFAYVRVSYDNSCDCCFEHLSGEAINKRSMKVLDLIEHSHMVYVDKSKKRNR